MDTEERENGNTVQLWFHFFLDESNLEIIRKRANELAMHGCKGAMLVTIEYYPELDLDVSDD